jgi:hypothetical protein
VLQAFDFGPALASRACSARKEAVGMAGRSGGTAGLLRLESSGGFLDVGGVALGAKGATGIVAGFLGGGDFAVKPAEYVNQF